MPNILFEYLIYGSTSPYDMESSSIILYIEVISIIYNLIFNNQYLQQPLSMYYVV